MSDALTQYVKSVEKSENPQVASYRAEIKNVLAEIEGDDDEDVTPFVIESELDYMFAGEFLKHAKRTKAKLEERAKERTAPLRKALEQLRELDGDTIKLWGKVEKLLKDKIGEYTLAQIEAKEAVAAQIAEAAKAGDFDRAHRAAVQLSEPEAEVSGVSTSVVYVVDSERVDVSKAPREFLMLNQEAIDLYIKEFGKAQPKDLPGIPFKKEARVRGSKK